MDGIRAAVLEAPRKLVIKEYPPPRIGPDEMLVKTELAGVCGSDVKIFQGTFGELMGVRVPAPVVMGDEILGNVAEVGEKFSEIHKVRKGSRVIVEPKIPCGYCEMCFTGSPHLCEKPRGYGWIPSDDPPHLWGSYAENVYVPLNAKVHLVPQDIPAEAAILAAVLIGDGIHFIQNIGNVRVGDDVVIIGPGPQGLAAALVARERGAGMVVVAGLAKDRVRMDFAKELGADYVVDVEKEDLVERVRELTGGSMADVVVECAGSARAVQASLDLAKRRGTVVHMSITGMKEIPLVTQHIVSREIAFKGGMGPATNVRAAIKLVDSIVDRGKYPLARMISHKYPLDRSEDALKAMGSEIKGVDPIKAAIDPRQ